MTSTTHTDASTTHTDACDWAHQTVRPECPLCGGYLLPCTATATGIHPGLEQTERGNR